MGANPMMQMQMMQMQMMAFMSQQSGPQLQGVRSNAPGLKIFERLADRAAAPTGAPAPKVVTDSPPAEAGIAASSASTGTLLALADKSSDSPSLADTPPVDDGPKELSVAFATSMEVV